MADELTFDWDRSNIEHVAVHGVTPEEVAELFANDEIGIDFDVIGGEERWTVVGQTNQARILIIVYTLREDRVQVVTAFAASSRVRARYFAIKGV